MNLATALQREERLRDKKKGQCCDIWQVGVGKRYDDNKGSVRIFQNIFLLGGVQYVPCRSDCEKIKARHG